MQPVRCYTRVSTEEQAISGYSLPAQRAQLERIIADHAQDGWFCAGWYVDEGASAKSLKRPEFQRLLTEAQPGDIILVMKLDRMTRSVINLHQLLEIFEKKKLMFKSATEAFDTSTPNGRLMISLIALIAQWERETIADRTSMGKRQKVVTGQWSGGPVPFGYMGVESERVKAGKKLLDLVPDPQRAHIVPMIFERYQNGYGMRAICLWLNDDLAVRTANGARWRVPSLVRVLTNPIYCGDVSSGRRKGDPIRVQGSHEPLIARELFEKVQAIFADRKTMAPRQATGIYPLSGVAHCGVCGGRIDALRRIQKNGSAFYSYRCYNYVNGVGCGDGDVKPLSGVSGRIVEQNFLEAVERLQQPAELDTFFRLCQEEAQRKTGITANEVERLHVDLAEAQKAIQQWDRLYEAGRIEMEQWVEKTAPHNERIKVLRSQITLVDETPAPPPKAELASFAMNLKRAWEHLGQQERKPLVQRFVRFAGMRVLIYPDRHVELLPQL